MKYLAMALMLSLTLLPATGKAQEKKEETAKTKPAEEKRETVQKVIALRYANAANLVNLLRVFPVSAVADQATNVIALSGSREAVAAFEEAVKRLDVPTAPPRNIELTAYILEASEKPEAGGTIPPELQAVVKQLKSVFPFQGIRVLDTLVLRTREGQGVDSNGLLSFGQGRPASRYSFRFSSASATAEDRGRSIRIDRLRLSIMVPVPTSPSQYTYQEAGLQTDVDVREGQKVVVGKTGIEGSDKALIVVLSARVVE